MDSEDIIEEIEMSEVDDAGPSQCETNPKVVMKWQTCDDDCPGAQFYRLVVRSDMPDTFDRDTWPIIVRQQQVDGEWEDDEVVGWPGLDGSYSIVSE